jgi:hypothetical protein
VGQSSISDDWRIKAIALQVDMGVVAGSGGRVFQRIARRRQTSGM